MVNKKGIVSFEIVLIVLSMFAFAFILSEPKFASAATTISEPSECCERTNDGAWCVNAPADECDDSYASSPTSCETTSYCRTGTCYESEEGICMENTPQRVCNDNGGTWDSREIEEVPQCQLGCCVVADQAAFVSLVRCKRLSTLFGVENDYRSDITNEVECIATAQAQDMGACVYESDFERVCEFTTRSECGANDGTEVVNGTNITLSSQRTFYKDFLCSAEELNTACAKQTSTGCYQQEVYWMDSCGNRENVYSIDKERSWNSGKVLEADEICDPNDGSDVNCGNCDYFLGSRCSEFDGLIGGPVDGDYYCQKTECIDRDGNERINGESWCVYDGNVGLGSDAPGSRHYREVCVDGEVIVEPCADFRNEVCYEDNVNTEDGSFGNAGCRVNRWQDCSAQIEEDDCNNTDARDCVWTESVTGLLLGGEQSGTFSNPNANGQAFSNPTANEGGFEGGVTGAAIAPITGHATKDEEESIKTETNRPDGVCVPNFPPGLNFWSGGSSKQICEQASAKCVVRYEKGLLGGRKITEGEECLEEEWAQRANAICSSLGDCGGYVNYNGVYSDDGYNWVEDGKSRKFSQNTVNIISGGVIAGLTGAIIGLVSAEDAVGNRSISRPVDAGNSGAGTSALPLLGTFIPTTTRGAAKQIVTIDGSDFLITSGEIATGNKVSAVNLVSGRTGSIPLSAGNIASLKDASQIQSAFGTQVVNLGSETYNLANVLGDSELAAQLAKDTSALNSVGFESLSVGDGGAIDITRVGGAKTTIGTGGEVTQIAAGEKGLFGLTKASPVNALLSGLIWAGVAYGIGQVAGAMLGLRPATTKALSTAFAAGAASYKIFSTWSATSTGKLAFLGNPLTSVAIGAIVFALMYKSEDIVIVSFDCMSWQAPTGNDDCEVCNEDGLPCSEYRCESLGQSCELVNKGTEQETCVGINPRDVDPPVIKPLESELSSGHQYTNVKNSPPGPGFNIINLNSSDGCLRAFTPLEFGIETDEPSQCKIGLEHTNSFDEMISYVGGNNFYSYNHSEKFSLPSAKDIQNSSIEIENGKDMTFFLRCQDKNGNENEAEYAVRFCVDPTPDNTAPKIEATSIVNGGCVAEDQDTAEVRFYTNEPAECRWSPQDQDFENMQGTMSCSNALYQSNAAQLFTCVSELSGISRDQTNFYIRCKDYAGDTENERNTMKQSYEFNLRGSTALKMKNLQPNETIFGAVSPAPVELYVETLFGCNDGQAICSYSETGNANDYVEFFDTNNEDGVHTQRLDLIDGNHQYYVKCTDEGGNVAEDVADFRLDIDTNAPVVARVYEENELLKIVTVRDSECSYTFDNCDFSFDEGTVMPYSNTTVHVTEWNEEKTYYIKCRDEFRNEDADCSVIVKPTRDLFD